MLKEIEEKLREIDYNKFDFQTGIDVNEVYYQDLEVYPDISFEDPKQSMEINFFFQKGKVEINMLTENRKTTKNNCQHLESQRVYFFRSMSIEDFYKLFVVYGFQLQHIIINADN